MKIKETVGNCLNAMGITIAGIIFCVTAFVLWVIAIFTDPKSKRPKRTMRQL